MISFGERVQRSYEQAASTLVIGLAPRLDQLPLPIQRYDDPLLPYGRAVIEATSDVVCGYAFHVGAYLALGAAGAIALERTLAAVPAQNIKLLHAPFVTADYVRASYEDAFNADAVTLATSDINVIAAYVQQLMHGVFLYTTPADLSALPATQVGIYQPQGDSHYMLTMLDASLPMLHWRWGNTIFSAHGEDFREGIRTAALNLRKF